jgi:hypothetical protein
MKGIILTPEGKQEIEAKIAELERDKLIIKDPILLNGIIANKILLKTILSSATILPVEESWEITKRTQLYDLPHFLIRTYPQGVIIKPKH